MKPDNRKPHRKAGSATAFVLKATLVLMRSREKAKTSGVRTAHIWRLHRQSGPTESVRWSSQVEFKPFSTVNRDRLHDVISVLSNVVSLALFSKTERIFR